LKFLPPIFVSIKTIEFLSLAHKTWAHSNQPASKQEARAKPPKTFNKPKEMNAKEMNAVSTKVQLLFFPPVCPFAPPIFSQLTSYNTACFARVTSHPHWYQNFPPCDEWVA
jgi:hypothetical protein